MKGIGKWKPVVTGLALTAQLAMAMLPAGAALAEDGPVQTQAQLRPAPDAFYCKERKLGTWFYCDADKAVENKPAAAPNVPAAARLDAIGKQLDELKAKAILDPSPDNVVAYVRYQREQLDRASTFADVWSRAVWQHPDLDYTLQRPIATLGKRAWTDQRTSDRNSVMASLSQRYGLFYFYSASCGACEVFSPILKSVADQYAMSILPVSMDGGPNSAFSEYVTNSGQYERMGLSGGQVPALVLFDSVTKQPIPVGYGVMSADEIMQRIFVLTNVEPGSDY
ncbi:conjugal transfer protein TraF [Novosphingobium sp. 9U]|uniref:conjugal transfer protein TraF n=1 Tax=Novosphingobium sp. 9U TaxID=2653158 RepID=UPI0012F2B75B|nr:conjugal transfer protein TraF [Novosphingobium sp. 9U]VWX49862.1 IncF plasmid conjugative transfer pilus assembly protein TraF [Novosphingobium sp. 9U]